jgi:hypothetical protein
MSKSFYDGEHLLDPAVRELNGGILYMLQQLEEDVNDVYNEVSASAFQSSFFPFARINSGSFGSISSSLIPDKDDSYDLGSSGKEWNDLYVDGTAYIDDINYQGTALAPTITELNYVDGVTSAIQTQLDAKEAIIGSSNRVNATEVGTGVITNTEFNTLNGIGSTVISTQLGTKLPLAGGQMTGLIRPVYTAVSSITNGTIDVRAIDVLEISLRSGVWTLNTATIGFKGQKLIIIVVSGGTITHSTNTNGFINARGRSLTARPNSAYEFVSNGKFWYQIVP